MAPGQIFRNAPTGGHGQGDGVNADAPTPLRRGWTTGTCAAAAAAAAYQATLTGRFPDPVTIGLPRGGTVTLPLARAERCGSAATVGVIKDAGDDPDVTHGAEVSATVVPAAAGSGVTFRAGPGVGTVTRPGLPLPVGEPAINPGPRAMIRDTLGRVAARFGGSGDATVTIAIAGGEILAAKTLNARLGIEGGLSVLGTTGVVVPFSCAAWIHSIHRGIDVALAAGLSHLAAATGSTSEAAVRRRYGLPDVALIDMGDFVGGTLKYLRRHPVERLSLAGGFAKLAKLAQGHLNLHSSRSRLDLERLAGRAAALGAASATAALLRQASTAAEALMIADGAGLRLADAVAADALAVVGAALDPRTSVEILVFDRAGALIGRAP
ncbi:MAG: cobalt-precorrin-5B (C(1))-methyltransferase [Rhodospirillales bacterium]|nr:MAG: cobalt-precorrin-5B (C(1))-methyltransferase [Rhodospirillales bacterium]